MKLSRVLVAVGLLAGAAMLPARADEKDKPKTGFVDKTFKNADGTESPYVVFVPKDYDGTKEYPVILFLHGAGETKNPKAKKEGKMPVEVGIGPAIKKRADFPFITVIPRAESFGWGAETANAKRALAMLDEVMKAYKIDAKRQYLTGLSMGGMGTWSIAVAMPDRFAAIVPICGRGDPTKADKIKDLPCWAFHGDADTSVPVSGSRDMIEAIKKAGGKPKYTEYPKVGHNSWDMAYGTDELYKWLLEQKKK
jgi:predicted peptidase